MQVNVKGLFFYIFVGIPNYKFIHIDVEICTWYIGSLVLTKYLILIVKAGFISIKKIIKSQSLRNKQKLTMRRKGDIKDVITDYL